MNKLFNFEKTDKHIIFKIFGIKISMKRREEKRREEKRREEKLLPESLVSCQILHYDKLIQKGTIFPHLFGIVIARAATIGNNCRIYQNVTIGAKDIATGHGDPAFYPTIGNNVTIYAGAVIIGPVHIGDNAVIGANAVVTKDVPANATAVGIPAKIVSKTTV